MNEPVEPYRRVSRTGGQETLLTGLIRHRIAQEGGTHTDYARHLGVTETTISRWLRNVSDPLAEGIKDVGVRERLADDLGYDLEILRELGSITIPQACETAIAVSNLAKSEHEQ